MKRQKDRPPVSAELWEKWVKYASIALLCIVLLYGLKCCAALFNSHVDCPPCMMYEDRLYFCPYPAELHLPEEAVFCGRIENSVEIDEWPTENFQSDRPMWDGKDIYWISADRITIQTDEGWLYFEVETEE